VIETLSKIIDPLGIAWSYEGTDVSALGSWHFGSRLDLCLGLKGLALSLII
jgi:hypothetical protein